MDVVFGNPNHGYIADDGTGIDPAKPAVALKKSSDGIWEGDAKRVYSEFKSMPYMFRIVNAQNDVVYRTEIYSRSQIGKGSADPQVDSAWTGTPDTLDGTLSCNHKDG